MLLFPEQPHFSWVHFFCKNKNTLHNWSCIWSNEIQMRFFLLFFLPVDVTNCQTVLWAYWCHEYFSRFHRVFLVSWCRSLLRGKCLNPWGDFSPLKQPCKSSVIECHCWHPLVFPRCQFISSSCISSSSIQLMNCVTYNRALNSSV